MKEESPYILSENLMMALNAAIEARQYAEFQCGYMGKSAYLAGLESNLEYLREHGKLEVRQSP